MKKHVWIMVLCCLILIVGLAALRYSGIPFPGWTTYLFFLICPLSHVVMMAAMRHSHKDETVHEMHHVEPVEKQITEQVQVNEAP